MPAQALGLALNMVAAGFLFGFLGHWVGTRIGAADILAVVGALVGAAAGFYNLYAHLTERQGQDRDSDSR